MRSSSPTSPLHFVVPGSLDRPTGGDRYDARMASSLRRRGLPVRIHGIPGGFPRTDDEGMAALDAVLRELPSGSRVVVDGLVLGGLPQPATVHGERLRIVALVHHPLADETGRDPDDRARLLATEGRALAAAAGVVVTSRPTAERVQDLFAVPPDRIRVAVPGTDPAPAAIGPGPGEPPRLLSVGAVIPRKGYDVLVEALGPLRERPWTLDCVGSLSAAPEYARNVKEAADRRIGQNRVRFPGRVSDGRLATLFHRSSAFVLASHYEGYGMALSEALARGLPVVSTTGGAIPETVPSAAGILVPPGDTAALSRALARLLGPSGARLLSDLARSAREHGTALPDWDEAAGAFHEAVDDLAAPISAGGAG